MTASGVRVEESIDTSNYRKHTHGNPLQRRLLDRFHHRLLALIASLEPDSFLDAGCGEGFVARRLLDQMPGMTVAGFDHNPAAVALAQRTNPGARFLTASIYEIPFESNAFDVVGCVEVLEHTHDPAAALSELLRVSGHAVVISVPHEPWFCTANAARGKNLNIEPRGSDPDHRQFWTRQGFGDFVSQQADVIWLDGSFPWTLCAALKR